MSTLVLNKSSISVKLESNHLLLHDNATDEKRRVPLVDIERVVVVGQPSITFPVLVKLMDMEIPCSFLTRSGRWRGMMDGDGGFHSQRRRLQYRCFGAEEMVVFLTRELVAAKIGNSRRTLQRLASEHAISLNEFECWLQLNSLAAKLNSAVDRASIRGVEGIAANCYFRLLSMFFPSEAPFPGRSRRPPKDAANAVLSFCYVLLTNVVIGIVRAHGLDVSCGFFHRGGDRSPALALDLIEPFRPVLADRLAVGLLSHRRLRVMDHFEDLGEEGVSLNEDGRKIVFRAFDEMMSRKIKQGGHLVSISQIVDLEVCRLVKTIESDGQMRFFKAA